MFSRQRLATSLFGLGLLLLLAYSTLYIVDQRRYAIIFGLGEVKKVVKEPGLHFKLPRPFETVFLVDNRIQTIDGSGTDRFITAEKKNIQIDNFIKWRVADPRLYFISFSGDIRRAEDRLTQSVKAALNEEVTKRTVNQVVASDRANVMAKISAKVKEEAKNVGIDIVDVRFKGVKYVDSINDSVYGRMRSERTRVANELRSTGSAESEKIRANADRQREEILAKSYTEAQRVKGEADAEASRIYAQSFGRSPEFYQFSKSLEAYRQTFKNKGDIVVVDQNSAFFQFMKSPNGR